MRVNRTAVLLVACILFLILMGPMFCRIIQGKEGGEGGEGRKGGQGGQGGQGGSDVIGEITRISDGDSLRIRVTEVLDEDEVKPEGITEGSELKLRLHGIDAPEIGQECLRHGQPFRCGVEATNILKVIVADIPSLECDLREKDRYGRWVAVCYLGEGRNVDISRAMVLRGYATAFSKYSRDYVADEEIAKSLGHGLWEMDTEWVNPSDYRKEVRRLQIEKVVLP